MRERAVRRATRARAAALGLGLSALTFSTLGCGHGEESVAKGSTDAATRTVVVTASPLTRRTVERRIEIEGTLKAWEDVALSAKKGGRVLRVLHDMGDRIEPGTPLLELDPVDADLAVLQAEARFLSDLSKLGITRHQATAFVEKYGINESLYNAPEVAHQIDALPGIQQARTKLGKARLDLDRQESMYRQNAGTKQDLQNAQNEFEQAQSALDNAVLNAKTTVASALASWVALQIAQQDREDMVIRAPEPQSLDPSIDATQPVQYAVTKRMVHEGQRLKDGEAVFELVIEHPIRLWANVPERYRATVRPDAVVRLQAQSLPDETFEGKVARINPAVDATSRTFQVEAIIPNTNGLLHPGGFARGEIVTARADEAVVVPVEAVYSYAGVTKVFLVENGKAHGYSVRVGRQYDRGVEVIPVDEALPQSGMVVDTGQSVLAKLAEGSPVVIREPGTGGATRTTGEPQAEEPAATDAPPAEASHSDS